MFVERSMFLKCQLFPNESTDSMCLQCEHQRELGVVSGICFSAQVYVSEAEAER